MEKWEQLMTTFLELKALYDYLEKELIYNYYRITKKKKKFFNTYHSVVEDFKIGFRCICKSVFRS